MRRKNSTPPDRGQEDQSITVGGLGTAGGDYKTRVRAVSHEGVQSEWSSEVQFTLTDSAEGTGSDPNLPDLVSNVEIRGMLNAIYVEFDDEFFATDKPLMSYNMGSYEIEVSNVSNAFPATGNVWTTKLGDDPDAGPPDGPTRKFNVPTGAGFICTGMKSTGSGGLEHFVRVRGINSNGSTSSAYSTVASVTLDTDDVSQTAVVIGQNAIYATHVKAGTLTAEELQAGTITATEISSGQIFASQIQLPAANPGTDGEANEFHATRKFTIDQDGNMWWGNYEFFDTDVGADQAAADANSAFHNNNSYISASGNAQFVGTISTGAGLDGDMFAGGDDGESRMVLGDNAYTLGFGGSSTGYGYLLGFTGNSLEAIPGHAVFTEEYWVMTDDTTDWTGAAYLVAPRLHGGFNYAGVRLRDPQTGGASNGDGEALLVHPSTDYMGLVRGNRPEGSGTAYAEVTGVVTAPGGWRVTHNELASGSTPGGLTLDSGTPATGDDDTGADRVKLWNDGGDLMWGDTNVGGGSGDITAVNTATNSGLSGGAVSGAVGLNVDLSNLPVLTGAETLTTSDWVGIYDNDESQNNKVTVGDIVGLAPQGDVIGVGQTTSRGIVVTGQAGPTPYVGLDIYNNLSTTTIDGADWVAVWDSNLNAHRRVTIQSILDLGGGGDVTGITTDSTSGLYTVSSGGPIPDIRLDVDRLATTTVSVSDLVAVFDFTAGGTRKVTVQSIVDLAASQTGNLTLGGTYPYLYGNNLTVQATGNAYLRAGSGGNYGVTVWSGGETTIYNGTTANFKALGGYNQSLTIFPDVDATRNLGSGSKWWNYLYAKKMDFSAIAYATGTGYYLWLQSADDQIRTAGSSERIKKDITTVVTSDALDRIKALRPVEFSAKKGHSNLAIDNLWEYERFRGFIAEEAAAVSHQYGVYNWWKSNDPESEDYDKPRPHISTIQDEWTDEEVAAYYDLDEAKPHMYSDQAILADAVAAIQALEARIAVLEG